MMACTCANLRQLDCKDTDMELPIAQALLRLIPQSLEDLELRAEIQLCSDTAWSRLTRLQSLRLDWPAQGGATEGCGLELLPALQSLSLIAYPGSGRLIASKFAPGEALSNVTSLNFEADPFSGALDIHRLQALREIKVLSDDPVPSWLEGQDFHTLHLWESPQLTSFSINMLMCHRVVVMFHDGPPPKSAWKLSLLLKMPCLEDFSVKSAFHMRKEMFSLEGTREEYQALMRKVRLDFQLPAQLRLQKCGLIASCIGLRCTGHTDVCLCAECIKDIKQERPSSILGWLEIA